MRTFTMERPHVALSEECVESTMAHLATTIKLKRNAKLESLLKRSLSSQVYDDIRYYESCVVDLPKMGIVHKFAVLTSQAVLIADQPKCILKFEVKEALKLEDVFEIKVVHDSKPSFLNGSEKETTIHIRMRYKAKLEPRAAAASRSAASSPVASYSLARQRRLDRQLLEDARRRPSSPDPDEEFHFKATFEDSDSVEREVSSLLHQVKLEKPRIPRSWSSLATGELRGGGHVTTERRSYSSLDAPKSVRVDKTSTVSAQPHAITRELNLHTLQPSSNLHTQLQSYWWSKLLMATSSLERKRRPADVKEEQSMNAMYNDIKRCLPSLGVSDMAQLNKFKLVLERNLELKTIFWKDQIAYHHLVGKLDTCLHMVVSRAVSADQEMSQREADLRIAVLLMETLLSSMHDSDCVREKLQITLASKALICLGGSQWQEDVYLQLRLWMFQHNECEVLKCLLQVLLIPPAMPQRCSAICSRMLDSYRQYITSTWRNLPEVQLIVLSADITNMIVAVLYEILITLDLLFNTNIEGVITHLLEDISVELYIERCMTQLLFLLSGPSRDTLKAGETVLIYKHFFVLKYLMESHFPVQEYVQLHYEEEIKYYMKWYQISPKISETCLLKPLVQNVVERVSQLASTT